MFLQNWLAILEWGQTIALSRQGPSCLVYKLALQHLLPQGHKPAYWRCRAKSSGAGLWRIWEREERVYQVKNQ